MSRSRGTMFLWRNILCILYASCCWQLHLAVVIYAMLFCPLLISSLPARAGRGFKISSADNCSLQHLIQGMRVFETLATIIMYALVPCGVG
jgi:hypothetical protein